jgi:hypothetical protein
MESTNVKSTNNQFKGVISIIVLVVLGWYFWGGGMDKQVKSDMQKVENSVALDAVSQYEIAERGGDKMQMYAHASLCAAAFLQAKDEVNYKKWLEIEHKLAKEIGMPEY